MTNAEAIQTLKLMQAQVEWEYPMEYSAAIDEVVKALEVQDILLKALSNFETTIPCDELMDDPDEEEICYTICGNYGDNIPPKCWMRWALMKAKERKEEVE